MAQEQESGGILVGGPRDQNEVDSDAPIIHLRIDNLVHRYIRTRQHRAVAGRSLVVYNYDGEERAETLREPPAATL